MVIICYYENHHCLLSFGNQDNHLSSVLTSVNHGCRIGTNEGGNYSGVMKVNWKSIRKRFLLSLVTALLLGLVLLYECWAGNYEVSHGVLFGLVFIIGMLFLHVNRMRVRGEEITKFMGLEKSGAFRLMAGLLGGFFLSIYLLLSDSIAVIPPVLQFSIIPITAVLGGLVIAGANYAHITAEQRSELLRVAQNLIVATIAFIFFTVILFAANIGESIDPNKIPTTQLEWIKFVLYWSALLSFFSGTCLFVIGIINLSIGLNNLKKP